LAIASSAEKIQQHWGIENQVHWVKDVIFQEDKSRINNTIQLVL